VLKKYRLQPTGEAERHLFVLNQRNEEAVCFFNNQATFNTPKCIENTGSEESEALDAYLKNFKELYPDKKEISDSDIATFKPTMKDWGRLELSSKPADADVYLKNSLEGRTTIKRVYPVGIYTLRIDRNGCAEAFLDIQISANTLTKKAVTLKCAPGNSP